MEVVEDAVRAGFPRFPRPQSKVNARESRHDDEDWPHLQTALNATGGKLVSGAWGRGGGENGKGKKKSAHDDMWNMKRIEEVRGRIVYSHPRYSACHEPREHSGPGSFPDGEKAVNDGLGNVAREL